MPSTRTRRVRASTPSDAKPVATPQPAKAKAAKKEEEAPSPPDTGQLTNYEAERDARVAANKKRLAELRVPELGALLLEQVSKKSKTGASQRGAAGRAKREKEPAGPPRRSGRVKGEKVEGIYADGVADERRDGSVVLGSGTVVARDGSSSYEPKEKLRPSGDLPFSSNNASEEDDAAFVASLAECAGPGKVEASSLAGDGASLSSSLAALSLDENDVAKVTMSATTFLAFLPRAGCPVIAGGDKRGNVGLWRYDHGFAESDASDGVRVSAPHLQYISGLQWKDDRRLLTCSYDGSVRELDAETGISTEVFVDDEVGDLSSMDSDGSTLYVAHTVKRVGCYLRVLDTRARPATASVATMAHDKKINTVSLEPGDRNLLMTASTDTAVKIWDVRKLGGKSGKAPVHLCELPHSRSSQGAYWAPDGSKRVLSTCYDDTLALWTPGAAMRKDDWTALAAGAPSKAAVAPKAAPKKAAKAKAAPKAKAAVAKGAKGKGKAAVGKGAVEKAARVNLAHTHAVQVKHCTDTGQWVLPFRAVWFPRADGFCCGTMKRGVAMYDDKKGKALRLLKEDELMTAIPSRLAFHPCPGEGKAILAAATNSGRFHLWKGGD